VPPPPEKHFRLIEPVDDAVDCIVVPALGSEEPLPPPEQALVKIIPLTATNARRRESMISRFPFKVVDNVLYHLTVLNGKR
jgi:hypothetical protein